MTFSKMQIRTGSALCLIIVLSLIATAVSPAQELTDEQPIYKYVGNLFSLKFHRPSCKFARAMWRGHVIRFQYRYQAIDAGQKPCRYCLPPDWKSVGAKILGTGEESSPDATSETSNPTDGPQAVLNVNETTRADVDKQDGVKSTEEEADESGGLKAKAKSGFEPTEPTLPMAPDGQPVKQPLNINGNHHLDIRNSASNPGPPSLQ